MRPAPFIARWESGPVVAGAFQARLRLDDDALFAGHYPGAPILPGSFLVEALFQAASTALGGEVHLEEIVACRFHSPLLPGDEVLADFELKKTEGGTIVQVNASGRTPAAALTMVLRSASSAKQAPMDAAPFGQGAGPESRTLAPSFIHQALPHRYPALLVDKAFVVDPAGDGPALLAHKAITLGERCYAGADRLTTWGYPSSLVIESFCQACGLLRVSKTPADEAAQPDDFKVRVVAKLAKLRFFGAAVPGDLLEHQIRIAARTPDGAVFSGQTVVAGRVILDVGRVVAAVATL